MTRHEAREQAFIIIFEKSLNGLTIDEIIENAKDAREFRENGFILSTVNGVFDNIEEIDKVIEKYLTGWKIDRISKVCLAVLRLSVYEIVFSEGVPAGVSINEAVELCKKFATADESSYVNGILGNVAREEAK